MIPVLTMQSQVNPIRKKTEENYSETFSSFAAQSQDLSMLPIPNPKYTADFDIDKSFIRFIQIPTSKMKCLHPKKVSGISQMSQKFPLLHRDCLEDGRLGLAWANRFDQVNMDSSKQFPAYFVQFGLELR